MKIFDCFMFYDEKTLLDIRLNILNEYVDYFVIVESKYFHNGKERELKFNINEFSKFKEGTRWNLGEKKRAGTSGPRARGGELRSARPPRRAGRGPTARPAGRPPAAPSAFRVRCWDL